MKHKTQAKGKKETKNIFWQPISLLLILLFIVVTAVPTVFAAGGDYSDMDFAAADPLLYDPIFPQQFSSGPPTQPPTPVVLPTAGTTFPSGRFDGASELPGAEGGQGSTVESLEPRDLALGQIVPFELRVDTSSTVPDGDCFTFIAGYETVTTPGDAFGFDEEWGMVAAFVDSSDPTNTDPTATVNMASWELVGTEIQATVEVCDVSPDSTIVVEMWIVLDEDYPDTGAGGNVQTRLIDAYTSGTVDPDDSISTGNQTVPLLQVGKFTSVEVDLSIDKVDFEDDSGSGEPVSLDGTITYQITVTNTNDPMGNTPYVANDVVVTDSLDPNTTFVSATSTQGTCSEVGGVVTCDIGALIAGQSETVTITVSVNSDAPYDGDGGDPGPCAETSDLCNSVVVTSLTDDPNPTNNSDEEPTDVIGNPSANVSKSYVVQLVDGGTADYFSQVGDQIDYTITVNNDGDRPLTLAEVEAAVTDQLEGNDITASLAGPFLDAAGTTPVADGELLPVGSNWYYTFSYTIVQADIDRGSVTNVVCEDADGDGTDECDTVVTPVASLSIVKTATSITNPGGSDGGTTVNEAGDTINYEITVDNTGDVDLTNVVVEDPLLGGVLAGPASGDTDGDGELDVDETWVYEGSYLVTQEDIDAGGNIDLDGDGNNDAIHNEACVDSDQTTEVCDDADVPVVMTPELTVAKSADVTYFSAVDDVINYTITVVNDGNVTQSVAEVEAAMSDTLNSIEVPIDSLAGPFESLDPNVDATGDLSVGGTWYYTFSYTIVQADIDRGSVTNVVCEDADGDGTDECDTVVTPIASLSMVKTATSITNPGGSDGGTTVNEAGDTINYEITVDNTGDVDLTNVVVEDPLLGGVLAGPASGDTDGDGELDVDETWVYEGSYLVTQEDIDAGGNIDLDGDGNNDAIHNEACVDSDQTTEVCDDADVPVVMTPELTVAKSADVTYFSAVDDVINYTITVVNDGNVTQSVAEVEAAMSDTLNSIEVPIDSLAGPFESLDPNVDATGDLSVGGTWYYTFSYTIVQADIDRGSVTNVVCEDADGDGTDECDTVVTPVASLSIVKTATSITNPGGSDGGTTVNEAGDTINYEITVDNTGDVDLTNVVVEDPLLGGVLAGPASGDTDGDGELDVDETWVYEGSYLVTQEDIDAGGNIDLDGDGNNDAIHNEACVDSDQTTEVCDDADVPVVMTPELTVAKSADVTYFSAVDDVINYTITVVNDGNVTQSVAEVEAAMSDTLNSIEVPIDSLAGPFESLDPNVDATGDLSVGGTWYYTFSYTIVQADIDRGSVTNVVCEDADGDGTDECDDVVTPIASLSMVKTATSITNPGGSDGGTTVNEAGDTINYEITVDNTGDVDLTNVVVEDPLLGGVLAGPASGDTDGDGELDVDETWVYEGSYLVTQEDIDAGGNIDLDGDGNNDAIHNEACVDSDQTTEVCDDADVPVDENPSKTVTKTASSITNPDGTDGGSTVDEAGDTINYTIEVDNDGNQTLTNVVVEDPLLGGVLAGPASGDTDGDGELDVDETWVYEGSYLVTQEDIDAGGNIDLDGDGNNDAIHNEACVDSDQTTEVCDDADVPVDENPSKTVTKTASSITNPDGTDGGSTVDEAGDTINYTIEVDNDGNQTLTNVVVEDPLLGGVLAGPASGDTDGDGELDVDETWVYEGSYLVTQEDIDAGGNIDLDGDGNNDAIHNEACVDSDQTTEVCDDADVPVDENPSKTVTKTASSITNPDGTDGGSTVDEAGDTINYTIEVDNDGNQTLTNVVVEDPLLGGVLAGPASGDTDGDGELDVDETWVYEGSYLVTQEDIDAGGNIDLDGDGNNDAIHNEACVDSDQTTEVCDDADVPVDENPSKTVTKTASSITNPDGTDGGSTVDEAGDTINYTIEVDNDGNQTLTNVVVEDPLLGGVLAGPASGDTDGDGELDVDETWVYEGSYLVTQEDIDAGGNIDLDGDGNNDAIHNEACVDSDQTTEVCDDADVPVDENPSKTVTKTASSITNPDGTDGGSTVDEAGDTINYTIEVDNDGNQTLTNVVVEDPLLGGVLAGPASGDTDGDGELDVDETWVYEGSYLVTQEDIDAGGNIDLDGDGNNDAIHNEACVDSDQTTEVCDDADVPVDENPSKTVTKTASSITNPDGTDGGSTVDEAGDTINYTIEVDNDGNQTLTNVVVEDPLLGGVLAGPASGDTDGDGELDVDETWVYEGSYLVTQEDIDAGGNIDLDGDGNNDAIHNEACVDSDQTTEVCDDADVPVDENPSKTVTKTASSITNPDGTDGGSTVDEAGDTINYTIEVDNDGNQTLTNVVVEDPLLGGVLAGPASGDTDGDGELDVDETWVYEGSYLVTQEDIDAGGNIDLDGDGNNDAIHNEACVDSDQTTEVCDDADVPVDENPSKTVTKTASSITNPDGTDGGSTVDEAGDTINYTIEVDNDGNQTLTNVVVEDPLLGGVLAGPASGDTDGDGELDVDETWVYEGSYLVTQEDIDAGGNIDLDGDGNNDAIHNEACVDSDQTTEVCDDADVPVVQNPDFDFVKDFDPDSVQVGGEGMFTLVFTNTGNVTLSDVEIADTVRPILEVTDVMIDAGGECVDPDSDPQTIECSVNELAPDEVVTVKVTYTAVAEADTLVVGTGQTSGATYVFYFVNGYTLYGSTEAGTATLRDPDGNEVDAAGLITDDPGGNDILFDTNGDDPGGLLQLHLSCSELFIGGWPSSGQPVDVANEWQIDAYDIDRYNSQGFLKDCGQAFTPFDVINTAYAQATSVDGTVLGPVSSTDDVTIIDDVSLEVSRSRVRKENVELQLHNFGTEDLTLVNITVAWSDPAPITGISLDTVPLWSGSETSPLSVDVNATLVANSKMWLVLSFDTRRASTDGLVVTLTFDNGSTFVYPDP